MKYSRRLFVLVVALVSGLALAAAGNVDKQASSIGITFTQMGVPVSAKFTDFSGTIVYDPASVGSAKAQLTVQLASFDLGDAEYNKEVQKQEWFDAARFPQATFTSTAIKALSPNKLQAQGVLAIKGKALDVAVPIELKQNGNVKTFSGVLPISRLYFNIGEGEWKATDILADEVVIKFNIVASTR